VAPVEAHKHSWKRTIIPAHPQAIQQRRSLDSVSEEQGPHYCIRLVDDAFGHGMVIVPQRPDSAIREPKILPLESVASANSAIVDCDKILIKNGASIGRKPAWFRVLIEHQVPFGAARLKSTVEFRNCWLVFRAIRLDDDGQG